VKWRSCPGQWLVGAIGQTSRLLRSLPLYSLSRAREGAAGTAPQKWLHRIARVSYQQAVNAKPLQGNGSEAPSSSGGREQRRHIKSTASLYIAWVIAAAMLISAAVGRHPYSFYTLLRWICCVAFAYSAISAFQMKRVAWTWIFGVLAILFNPLAPEK